jgi:hypothetical protein
MVILPHQYSDFSTYDLLQAIANGRIGFDHRVLHVILDRGEQAIPDLVRFGTKEPEEHEYDLSDELIAILRHLPSPAAIPFFIEYIRRDPTDISDDLADALRPLGDAVVEPLLKLYEELGEEQGGEVLFLLAAQGVRDKRILKHLIERLDYDLLDATISLSLYGDPDARPALEKALAESGLDAHLRRNIEDALEELGRPQDEYQSSWDIWDDFPEKSLPEFGDMSDAERLQFFTAPDAEYRLGAVASCITAEPSEALRQKLRELAQSDEDAAVRGKSWEALADAVDDDNSLRDAMLARLRDKNVSIIERKGALLGLSGEASKQPVRSYVEEFYENEVTRAAALKAMWSSMDRTFSPRFAKHLDDKDPEVVTQAIAGIGYLGVYESSEQLRRFFDDEEHRPGALFAYALSARHEISRGRIHSLYRKVEEAAGGLAEEEEDLVKLALDERLLLHGQQPVFNADRYADAFEEPASSAQTKVGRNDPCPCGSGKKYKKCCGAE